MIKDKHGKTLHKKDRVRFNTYSGTTYGFIHHFEGEYAFIDAFYLNGKHDARWVKLSTQLEKIFTQG